MTKEMKELIREILVDVNEQRKEAEEAKVTLADAMAAVEENIRDWIYELLIDL